MLPAGRPGCNALERWFSSPGRSKELAAPWRSNSPLRAPMPRSTGSTTNNLPIGSPMRSAPGAGAVAVQADIARIEQVQRMVSATEQRLGPIDILINNAGVFPCVPFLEMTGSDRDYVLDVNLRGSCFCARPSSGQWFRRGGRE